MATGERMPLKSFGLLKRIAKERSNGKRVPAKSSMSLPSGVGLLDYVDMPSNTEGEDSQMMKLKKRKPRSHVCHPVVIVGLITVIVYITFMACLIGYFHDPKIKQALDSLKRLANIKEWLRIIFKPWHVNEGKDSSAARSGFDDDVDNGDYDEAGVGPYLDPEFDVNFIPATSARPVPMNKSSL